MIGIILNDGLFWYLLASAKAVPGKLAKYLQTIQEKYKGKKKC